MAGFPLDSQPGDPELHQILITCFFYHPGRLSKMSSQSVYNFLSNVANRQTDRQTNTTENRISLLEILMWQLHWAVQENDHL